MSTHKVSTLEFRANIYKWLDKMPLEVTAKGKTVFFVVDKLSTDNVSTDKRVSTHSTIQNENRNENMAKKPKKFEERLKKIKTCKHGFMVGLCKHGCK